MPIAWLAAAAAVDEWLHGPLPGDIVDTQGKHLVSRPSTPIYHPEHDPNFLGRLQEKLESLVFVQNLRTHKYGSHVAEQYPISHTPTEIKSSWVQEQAAFDDSWLDNLPPTPSDDGSVPSLISGKTFDSNTFLSEPELPLPSAIVTKTDSVGCKSLNIITQLRPASQRRLSSLDNSNNRSNIIKSLQDLCEQPMSIHSLSRKRRHSDAENDCPIEQEPSSQQKRRVGVPTLVPIISCR